MTTSHDRPAGEQTLRALEQAIRTVLELIGDDPDRPGLEETPGRVAHSYLELFAGLRTDPASELTVTEEPSASGPIVVRDVPLFSMCEHHLLPFMGRAHVAYLPDEGRITGFSKIARMVDGYARRPQVQERLTEQVAQALWQRLRPKGVAVVVEAEHLCMVMRGIRAGGSRAVTVAVRGLYQSDPDARRQLLQLLHPAAPEAGHAPYRP